jgi:two-component system sensor histidine kinase KdpD
VADAVPPRAGNRRATNWTLVGIFGLLIISILAVVPLTITFLQSRESDALLIDMAGRQRMLLERQMKELLLASEGVQSQYEQTRTLLKERLEALLRGGPVIVGRDPPQRAVFLPAPTAEIREKLLVQQRLFEIFEIKSDQFLQTPANTAEYRAAREDLLEDNAVLLKAANDAVELLTRYSDARSQALIRWETFVVLLIVTVASLLTWRFLEADKALKRSQAMTVEALRQSDEMKSALLSSVSHELRSPLTAIKSMLFGLQDDFGSQSGHVRKEFLRGIDQELDYLNRLVGNLLDMSRLEAGILIPQREWHVLDELVEGAIRCVGASVEGRPLKVEMAHDLPPVYVDGVQIQQVLINLLDNAAKFSIPHTPIRLYAAMVAGTIEVGVSNMGEGIPADQLDRIFDRFYRVRSGRSSTTPGTGLGLAICKGIVDAHGGQVIARSIPGEETTILFRLPLPTEVPSGNAATVRV